MMIKLYYAPGTCALSVHILLKWLAVEHEVIRIKLGDPDYLKINPLGAVPAITDGDGKVMTQCDAILKYLANKYPEAKLGETEDLMDAFELDHWLAFMTGDLHPAYFPFFNPQRYTTNDNEESISASKAASMMLIEKMLSHLENHLEGKSHVVGDRRTIADPYAFAMIRWSMPLDNYPNLKSFYELMLSDSGVEEAMLEQGIS